MKEKLKIVFKFIVAIFVLLFLGPLSLMPPEKYWGIGEILRLIFGVIGFLTVLMWSLGKLNMLGEKED